MNELVLQYQSVRAHSVDLCLPLHVEDYGVQPTLDASPPKWHLAHITWFWEEFILVPHLRGYKRFHTDFAYLFNSYYNAVGERVMRFDRGNMSRPGVEEVLAYRAYVDKYMLQLFNEPTPSVIELVELGLNHEQQHQELLLTDIKYILGHNPLFPAYQADFKETTVNQSHEALISLEEGVYEIGHQGVGFCFDNELSRHKVYLRPFAISNRLVTNAAYQDFMADGGYQNHQWWHSDGWNWVNENAVKSPLYWHKKGGQWMRYALSGIEEVLPNEPVTHVSFYEAAAFAEWAGMRLPTEFEWEVAADQLHWGTCWEHTNSAYLPYPGFAKTAGAIGEYNGKFMINQMVLRGASIATPAGHSRKTYRNFFHPHLRWQFTGIRLCSR